MTLKLIGIAGFLAAMVIVVGPVWSEEAAQPDSKTMPSQAADRASAVTIADAVACQEIVDRAPVGSSDIFVRETSKVFCFCRVVGAEPGTQIIHNWYYKGSLKASVKLDVRSSNYRTWSSKTLLPGLDGEWLVEILSHDSKPLDSIVFFVQ